MATVGRILRPHWLRQGIFRSPPATWIRFNSSFAHLEEELPKRKIAPTFEDLSPQSSYRLDMTLADYLPSTNPPIVLPPTQRANELPRAHHLVYFEPSKRASEMLADGTNPDQSPGEPFTRRMWAGGRVLYNSSKPLYLDASRAVCAEFIRNVSIKGRPGEEKIFVAVERRLARASQDEVEQLGAAMHDSQTKETLDHRVRQRLWRDSDEDFGPCSILETRNIVFLLPSRSAAPVKADAGAGPGGKSLLPDHKPDYTHRMRPDAKLLFRFSALTFNAHAIHLDPEYSRDREGHRNLLFHGPLSFTFLITLLQQHLSTSQKGKQWGRREVIKRVEYRNLAPLYCGEDVTFCGAKTGDGKWEIWAQTPQGGIAVKGKVVTEQEEQVE